MKFALAICSLIVIVMTIIPAVVDGQRRFRWGEDEETTKFAERLSNFPSQIGGWKSTGDREISKTSQTQLQPIATIDRVYFNASKQKQAHVFILLGPTGPTAVHTPDICFNSRDFRIIGKRRQIGIETDGSRQSKLFLSQFESRDANKTFLSSWYGWTIDGDWKAIPGPRYFFAKSRYLFKIQVVSRYASKAAMENDPDMKEFIAELERTIHSQIF